MSIDRAVFDCNVLLQAVLSADGPAFACLQLVEKRQVELLISEAVITEARDVLHRPEILRKNPEVTPQRITRILDFVARRATFVESVPAIVSFPRDPKDEPYLNLAVASRARYLVTRDSKHLLRFAAEDSAEAASFRRAYPDLQIINPPSFLHAIGVRMGQAG